MSKSSSKGARDNRANQLNQSHPSYWRSRGVSSGEALSRAAQPPPALRDPASPVDPTSDVSGQSQDATSQQAQHRPSNKSPVKAG